MTSLQNGNNNSRSMNGLTTIYANDITSDTIDTIDANVSNNLAVGNQLTVNGLSKLYSDLLIYDKSSPTKFPYRFTTTGSSLFFSYDSTTPRALFDVSLNTISGFPELNMRRIMNLYNNFQLQNNLEFRLGTIGGSTYATMKYQESTRNLSLVAGIGAGAVDSQFNITTNTIAGSPFVLQFTPTQLTVPNNIDIVGTGLCRGVFFKGITGIGGALLNSGLISEVNNTILTYGINCTQLTTPRDNTVPGGFFRLDTRLSGSNTFFQIRQLRAGETTENIVFSTHNSTFLATAHFGLRSNLQIEARQKINFYDITTPFTNQSDIYRNGASLIFESSNPNNQMVFNTADGTGVLAQSFLNSRATTDITSTNINLNGAVATTTNNITQTTGIISQSGVGTNLMKNITLNVDNNFLQSGTGIITQSGTITTANTLKETTITGTSPIQIIPRQPTGADATTRNALVFSDDVAGTGRSGFFLQNAGGTDLIQFGSNSFIFGNRNTTKPASYIRLDGRGTINNPLISFRIEDAGTTASSRIAYAIYDTSVARHFFDNRFDKKISLFDTITPFTASTDITKVGADLTIAGQNASSTLTISNRNASNIASNTFVSSTATTSITSTNINLNGTVATTTNNITQTSGRITQTGLTANTLGGITMNSGSLLTFQDNTTQRSKYDENILNECNIHTLVSGGTRTILQATFNLANATNASLVSAGTGNHFYAAIQFIVGQTYTGIGMYIGTAGTYDVGLYGGGLSPALLATATGFTSTANQMNYINFTAPYSATSTTIGYIAYRTTTAAQTLLYLPANTFLNFGFNTMTNGTLNKRAQSATIAGGFGAVGTVIPAGTGMTNQTLMQYAVLY